MRINHNIASLNTYRQLTGNTGATSKSLEKLSSGLRINRAGDDAAGLAISEKMRSQIRGLDQASRNAQDGISMIQTAEGALAETQSILQRMRELAVQSSNDTNTDADRSEIQKEINQLTSEINRIGNTTEFNTQKLLNGDKANTLEVSGVKLAGSTNTTSVANVDSTGLDIAFTTTNALSSGNHTLDVTVDRNTRTTQDVTAQVAGYTGGTGTGDGVEFEGNAITVAAGSVGANSDITLTYDLANDRFHMTGTLTGAPGGDTAIDEYINVGEDYNNHGISFKVNDTGTLANGETLIFTATAAGNTVGTTQVGYTATAATTHATFGANAEGYAGISLTDSAELANLGGGSVKITMDGTNILVEAYSGADGTGTKIISDTITGTTADYDEHGIKFNVTGAVAGGTDVITLNINSDTYSVKAQLDGAAAVTLDADYNGVAASGAVTNSTAVNGLSINQSAVIAAGSYSFNVETNITGEDKSATFQIGANTSQGMAVDVSDMRALALGVTSNSASATKTVKNSMNEDVTAYYTATKNVTNGTNNSLAEYALDVSSGTKATAAVKVIDDSITSVSAERSKLGAFQNRLEHTINNLGTSSENLTASESRIRDVDMAKEMMEFTKNNILSQAAQAMLAQANQQPQGVLQLLR